MKVRVPMIIVAMSAVAWLGLGCGGSEEGPERAAGGGEVEVAEGEATESSEKPGRVEQSAPPAEIAATPRKPAAPVPSEAGSPGATGPGPQMALRDQPTGAERPLATEPTPREKTGTSPQQAPPATPEQMARADSPLKPPAAAAKPSPRGRVSTEKQVLATLAQYEAAYEARDLVGLQRVWNMSPIEEVLVGRIFAECEALDLSLKASRVEVQGGKASASFDQTIAFECPGGETVRRSELEASLEQANGRWVIAEILDRGTQKLPAVSAAPPGVMPEERDVLSTIGKYEAALSACDLQALSRVWIMTPPERIALETFCASHDSLPISTRGHAVSLQGDSAAINFDQILAVPNAEGANETKISLQASLIRRGAGEWAIWRLRRSGEKD